MLAAVGPILGAFSACLQSPSLCYHDLMGIKAHYLVKIRSLRDHPARFPEYWQCAASINDACGPSIPQWEDITDGFVQVFHRTEGVPYLDRLVEKLEERLQDGPVLEALSIYDVTSPAATDRVLARERLRVLTDHFGRERRVVTATGTAVTPPMLDAEAVISLQEELNGALDSLAQLSQAIRSSSRALRKPSSIRKTCVSSIRTHAGCCRYRSPFHLVMQLSRGSSVA